MPSCGFVVDGERYSFDEAYSLARQNGLWNHFPPAVLRALANRRVDGHWVSPSDAGGCPRQRILKQREDYYDDPANQIVPTTGTALHQLLAGHAEDEVSTESFLQSQLDVTLRDGRVVPYAVQGTDDYHDEEMGILIDYKTTRHGGIWKLLPYDRHKLQINIYAYLRRVNGFRVERAIIWYCKQGGKEPKYEGFDIPLLDMLEVEYLLEQIAEPLAWYELTGELPQNIYDPKDYNCMYCPVVEHCLRYHAEGK